MGKERASAAARAAITVFLLFSAAFCTAAPSIPERLVAIQAFGSRAEGSVGESAAFDYVATSLAEAGLAPSLSDFSDAREDYSRSRIVEASIPGERDDELAVIVPLGSWTDRADASEGAYGIALALDEATRLAMASRAGAPPPVSLRFVFLGAEKRGPASSERVADLGSRTWLARQEGRGRLAVIYLDLERPPARIVLKGAGKAVLSPYWFYEGARRSLDSAGIPFSIEANRQQAYRLGLASDYGPAAPYLEAGIPAIELLGAGDAQLVAGDQHAGADWFPAFVGNLARYESGGFPDSWDRHYFIIQLGRLVSVFREQAYVAILVGLLALVVSSLLAATVARRSAATQLLKRAPAMAWELSVLFATLVLVILASKGLSLAESLAFGSAKAWQLMPRLFALARILFSLLLFLSLVSLLVEKRVLTPNPYFYELAGLVCLAVDVLVFSVVDLSASFYFIWALVLVELSLALRRRWSTLVANVLMYLPLLIVVGELALRPDLGAYGKLVAPGYLDVLALAALTLPIFVFSASPLLFFAAPGIAARKRAALYFGISALAIELIASASFLLTSPRAGAGRRDLAVFERIDQDAGRFELELSGLRRLGRGSILRGEASFDYASLNDKATISGPDAERRIVISGAASPFLDRKDEVVKLDFSTPPYGLELELRSVDPILLYDCSLPYKVAVDGRSALLFAGVNPGPSLSFSFTVPGSFQGRLVVRASYLRPLEPCSQSSGSPLAQARALVEASGAIGGAGG